MDGVGECVKNLQTADTGCSFFMEVIFRLTTSRKNQESYKMLHKV
jgi:hypothetical protein